MENPFDTVALDDDQKNRIAILRGEFKSLFASFSDYLEGSRYTSLAVTALEEAAFWANKSISFEQRVPLKEGQEVKSECCGASIGGCCKE